MDEAARRQVGAGRLLLQGKAPAEAAAPVGASRQTVHRWLNLLDADAFDGLRRMSKGGLPAQFDAEQYEQLRRILLAGPQSASFGTDLWTLKRVREPIQRRFGVQYSEVHVWHPLGRLGFPGQKPGKRSEERNEAVIERRKKRTWPAPKGSAARKAG